LLFNAKWAIVQLYQDRNKLHSLRWWWFPLCTTSRHWVGFYSARSFKKQSPGKHVAPFVHIILIPSQPVFALTPECCVLSVEATNNNFIVLGFTQTSLKPTIYHIRDEHVNLYKPTIYHIRDEHVNLYTTLAVYLLTGILYASYKTSIFQMVQTQD
jgi:hypothetical protein